MLRLTLLTACLLAALQIDCVAGTNAYRVRYLKLAQLPDLGDVIIVKNYTLNIGETVLKIYDSDVDIDSKCDHPHKLGVGKSLAVAVKDNLQYDNITIAEDLSSAVVSRETADHEASIIVRKKCQS